MVKRFLFAITSLLFASNAWGQQLAPIVVASCGAQSLTPGASSRTYIDATGAFCTNATGGGGGGGAVTIADGADVAEGATAATAWTGSGAGTVISISKAIYGAVTGSIPAGSAVIGKVTIDQTTPGTTNLVSDSNFPTTVSVNTGATGASSPRVTVATDTATIAGSAPGAAGTASTNVVTVQGISSMTKLLVTPDANSAVNVAQIAGTTAVAGNGVTGSGSQRVTIASDNTAFSVNAQPTPTTSGGLSSYFLQPTASDNHANVKGTAGQVYHIAATNNSATINYLRLYDVASGFNGCNSATSLVLQRAIPANSTNAAGLVEDIAQGIAFSSGIAICVTSAYALTDTTNATASAMSVSVFYK